MNDDRKSMNQKDNLINLASSSQTNTPQAAPVSNTPPPQNLRDNQVIGSNDEVIDLGRTSDNTSQK